MAFIEKLKCGILVWCGLAAAFGLISAVENDAMRTMPSITYPQQFSAVSALAGEFRVVFANLLWIKAEQYHHEYLIKHRRWTENKDLMSLLEIITTLDPHFVEAYEVGAYILAKGYKDPRRAVAYLNRGIAYNPDAWELHNIAAVMLVRLGDLESALKHARLASALCRDPFYKTRNLRLVQSILRIISDRHAVREKTPHADI